MTAPNAPIIVLRQGDDAVNAFFTTSEAVNHLGQTHVSDSDDLAKSEFFDARGRRLTPVTAPDGLLRNLSVASDESHDEHVRERVRRRAQDLRKMMEQDEDKFGGVDQSPLTLADEDITFEVFARRLASVLLPEPPPGEDALQHSAGWWHNVFGH